MKRHNLQWISWVWLCPLHMYTRDIYIYMHVCPFSDESRWSFKPKYNTSAINYLPVLFVFLHIDLNCMYMYNQVWVFNCDATEIAVYYYY